MKSSKNKKPVDDISRETQRLISSSHVRLPYHKPKQKSLKDFLNRQKITTEYQASITGSKKLLQKAWEFIESKEQNVEKFYNEDCSQNDDNEPTDSKNIEIEKNISLNNDDVNSSDKDLTDCEENDEINSNADSELSTNDVMCSFNDDEEEDSRLSILSSGSNKPLTQEKTIENEEDDSSSENFEDSEDESKDNAAKVFIDDEAELSELNNSSDDEENLPDLIDDSDEEVHKISKKKNRRLVLLSESSDDDSNSEIKLTTDDLLPLSNEPETNICTQQLMGLCSGQFQTQQLGEEENDEEIDDDFDSEVPQNEANICTQQLMDLCSGQFQTQQPEEEENDEEIDDDFDSEVPQNDANSIINGDYDELPKLVSAKDFFEDEAELSESDWSSDDEGHMADAIDKLEEEEGDKDKLDENLVKDGLDKIYMRQLLDDDQQQVTALKEMLLEDGDLHTDSGRKRKFQWDEANENDDAFKKPLFSDNEDEDEDEVLSDDGKSAQWRKDRFKRESYLSQKNSSDEEEINDEEKSNSFLQSSVLVVKKTHVVKYQKNENKKISNPINIEQNDNSIQLSDENSSSTLINVMTNEISNNSKIDLQVTNVVPLKPNKFLKGSFMKRNNEKKINNTLLFINKKTVTIDNGKKNYGTNNKDNSQIKSISAITGTANNPFAYLLRNNKNQDEKEIISDDFTNVEKKENIYLSKPSTSTQSNQQLHKTKSHKSTNSLLKQLD